jgi:transposase
LITLKTWEDIRVRCIRDKEPIKRVARELGISKNTVKKYIEHGQIPLPDKNYAKASAMSAFEADVDRLLKETPKITAVRIVQIIRTTIDPSFRISARAARVYVASRRVRIVPKEAFVRLVYFPGDQMQIDFKDVFAKIEGIEVKLHMFVARLSYSTAFFARCYRSEDRPALFDGILTACVQFGGIPREGVFDNASSAVKRILRGRDRTLNKLFHAFSGSLALPMQFAAPAKGNEKGGVEGEHGFIEDNFFRPMPEYTSIDALNADLLVFSDMHLESHASGESVAHRLACERKELRPLPDVLPETCIRESVCINKFSEIMYKTNRYSVPTKHAHRDAVLEVFHDRIRIVVFGSVMVAEHKRLFGRNEASLDPRHFIDLLSSKSRAVMRAEVFHYKTFDKSLRDLLQAYAENDPVNAGKRFMRVIALLEKGYTVQDVSDAVDTALRRGTDDPAAIELILRQEERQYHEVPPLVLEPGTIGSSRPITNLDAYDVDSLKEHAF